MLSKKYLNGNKNQVAIMRKIIEGTAPSKFTTEHLKKLGFTSSNDRAMIGILKELKFLSEDASPTKRYHDYRNEAKSKSVLGEALKEIYSDIFHLTEKPTQSDKPSIIGLFKSTHNVSDQVAALMANTFLTFLSIADISDSKFPKEIENTRQKKDEVQSVSKIETKNETPQYTPNLTSNKIIPNLRYNIEIHLPATKDIEVYNSIFKSLKEHLLNE